MATRIKLVETQTGMDKMNRLKLIGETSRVNQMLQRRYLERLLNHLRQCLLMPFLKFDTILTSFNYLRIFEKVGPLSIS